MSCSKRGREEQLGRKTLRAREKAKEKEDENEEEEDEEEEEEEEEQQQQQQQQQESVEEEEEEKEVVERPCPGFIAELLAHPVYSLAYKFNVEYFEAVARRRAVSTRALHWHALLVSIGVPQRLTVVCRGGLSAAEADLLWKRTRCKTCAEVRDLRDVAEAFPRIKELHTGIRLHAARAQPLCLLCRVSSICAVFCDWKW
jgi:hypothetical protein